MSWWKVAPGGGWGANGVKWGYSQSLTGANETKEELSGVLGPGVL